MYALRVRGFEVIVSAILLRVVLSVIVVLLVSSMLPRVLSIIVASVLLTGSTEILGRFFLHHRIHGLIERSLLIIEKMMLITRPIARPVGKLLDSHFGYDLPTIYSRQQLVEILEEHVASNYSDIEQEQIEIVKHALSFGDKQIRTIMTPKSVIVRVAANAQIGPVLMDELHASGHSRFPVYADTEDHIVGTLYIRSLTAKKAGGKVKDVMDEAVYYVHEELPLGHALQAFLRTKHHLFVVVNTFEEVVGIVTLEDVIEQIIGKQVVDEFDAYDNMREVAALRAEQVRKKQDRVMPASPKADKKNI
jgi:CBS domain containing-hemolysin-like protein